MSHWFRLTVRLLDAAFHGRGDGGEPEWPPSPLRAFQALVAAAAARWRPPIFRDLAEPALLWLERLGYPDILAPVGRPADRPYRLYVPNNAADLVAAAWDRGNPDASIADHRTEKDVRPTRLANGDAVHFDWRLTPEQRAAGEEWRGTLQATARSITHLGWGVDQAVGTADFHDAPPAVEHVERWHPVPSGGTPLRVPKAGTLAGLLSRHTAFLGRLGPEGFKPVPPLAADAFAVVGYRRAAAPAGRPFAAFSILKPDASGNAAFNTPRHARDVAAWVRNATGSVCEGWPFGDTDAFVHGHAADGSQLKGDDADDRFMYLPLPTINHKLNRVESIRRVIVAAPPGRADRVEWVRRRLPGQDLHELLDAGRRVVGLLNILPTSDWVLTQYTEPARIWSTVTPVVLPGYDDPDHVRRRLRAGAETAEVQRRLLGQLDRRVERLLRQSLRHAGLADELADAAGLEWRSAGFRSGVVLASQYSRPDNLQAFSAYHVRVTFPTAVCGPLAVGAGRYRGIGVFARAPG